MSTLKLSSDTLGGSVTLAAPETASNVTVTLPTTAGTLVTGDATSTITTYASVSAIPAGFVGTARVGTDLYVGDGARITHQVNEKSKVATKIANLLSKGKTCDYKTKFWTAPPAWQANTAYSGGAVTAGGNWYICGVAGTSGASAPTWTTTPQNVSPFGFITDNTTAWFYFSQAQTLYQSDTGVSVTFSTANNAALTNVYTPVTGTWPTVTHSVLTGNSPNEFTVVGTGGTVTVASWVHTLIGSNACYTVGNQSSGGSLCLSHSNGSYNTAGNAIDHPPIWEFNTDSQILALVASALDASITYPSRVWVDDIEVSCGPLFSTAAASNSDCYMFVNMTGPVRVRNVKVMGYNNLRRVAVGANSMLYPVDAPKLRVLAIGDSYFAGSGMGPSRPEQTIPVSAFSELGGINCVTNISTGGTGLNAPANVTPPYVYNWQNKISNLTTGFATSNTLIYSSACNVFDLIWVEWPNGNDLSADTTLPAKLLTFLQTLRTLQPTATIMLLNGWCAAQTSDNYDYMASIGPTVFAQWADNNSFYISAGADTGARWINGNTSPTNQASWTAAGYNASGHITAYGNTSLLCGSDQVHPNDAGIQAMAVKSAQAILNVLGIPQ